MSASNHACYKNEYSILCICYSAYLAPLTAATCSEHTLTNTAVTQCAGMSSCAPYCCNIPHHTNRASALELAQPRRVILIEGMLLLSDPALRAEIDIKLYVDTDADLR
jgi:hypothetical protein